MICEMCWNKIDRDTRYCEECKEYVGGAEICPDCKGEGEVDTIDYLRVNSMTISPPYHKVECENCQGEGIII